MKNYIKPEIETLNYSANSSIASGGLSDWLATNAPGAAYNDVITTFAYNS